MKRFICFIIATSLLLTCSCAKTNGKTAKPKYKLQEPSGNPVEFNESWGYVMQSRVNEYNQDIPLTDVCFFAADFDCYGELIDIPARSKLNLREGSRCHLVVICDK